MTGSTLAYKRDASKPFLQEQTSAKEPWALDKTAKIRPSDSLLTMAKNAATVVGKPAAIPEGDGGRDLMIQPVYITWTEKDGRLGLMRQWVNVRIIDDKAFVNPRVDIELLQPIEWTMERNWWDKRWTDRWMKRGNGNWREGAWSTSPSSPKRPRDDEEEGERRTSPRRSQGSKSVIEWREDLIEESRQVIRGRARAAMTVDAQGVKGTHSGGLASLDSGERRSPKNRKTRSGRPVPATYEECPDNSPVEYAERDPFEGLVEGEDYPSMSLQSGYEEELWRQKEEWARKNRWRLFGEDEEVGEN